MEASSDSVTSAAAEDADDDDEEDEASAAAAEDETRFSAAEKSAALLWRSLDAARRLAFSAASPALSDMSASILRSAASLSARILS
jgi:hypothetical protein